MPIPNYILSFDSEMGRIPEHEEHIPPSPVGKLTQSKLDRHNLSFGSSGGPAMTTGRRSFRDGKSETATAMSNKSGK